MIRARDLLPNHFAGQEYASFREVPVICLMFEDIITY
jgi:hypothetical protein